MQVQADYRETHALLRKRTFNVHDFEEIREIMRSLKAERFVGSVSFNVSQGTINSVVVEDKMSLPVEK